MSKFEFENYHAHTFLSNAYISFPDSPSSIEDYAKIYKERGMRCLCFSEHGYRGDVWKEFDVAQTYNVKDIRASEVANRYDMKAICAAEAYFVPDRKEKDDRNFHLILVAKNMEGFEELNFILSEANLSGFYKHARIDFDLLRTLTPDNFICTSACIGGIFKDRNGFEYAKQLHDIFGKNFYLEIQHHPNKEQVLHNKIVLEAYKDLGYPLIFGTDSHYVNKEDKILREELQLSKNIKFEDSGWELYLPTAEEAEQCFKEQGVFSPAMIEEAFENTLQLRDFDGFEYNSDRKFPITRRDLTYEEREYAYQKTICDNYIKMFGKPTKEEGIELRKEMNTVLETKSVDYFLSLHDIIKRGIELGGIITKTSRGSAASFATSAALGFTSLNRLHEPVKLFPERFVSKEKLQNSMADVDTNCSNPEVFEQAGRELLGEYGCFPMIALGKQQTLSAFKMLARARNLDFQVSNDVSKQISNYELDRKHALENNQDDPDYNVDEEIDIANYVSDEHLQLIEDSKEYKGIITSIAPHPCARLCYHEDIRRKVGLISLKPKAGSKDRTICACIEGATADASGLCKIDLLKVDVVSVINDTFKAIGRETPNVDELKDWIENNPQVWDLYANGFVQGLNQCEKAATKMRVMKLKPKNSVELSAFVAAIRPGAKSLVDDFINRRLHTYDIPAMDELLRLNGATGVTGESSYLFFDEQVAILARAAGIDAGEAVLLQKAIKKKKLEKVLKYEQQFVPGFKEYLKTKENASEELAEKTAHDVWTVILNGASYLFNASHALSMCYDSLYGAMLKTIAPYEFYCTLLKLYTKKGQLQKIAITVEEMKKYMDISLTIGQFGQDNRDWYIDKENHTISQSLSSIKYISNTCAKDLYEMRNMKFDSAIDLFRYLQMNTCLDTRQTNILITLGYFNVLGFNSGKLRYLFKEYNEGKNKVTKTIKSYESRMEALKELEKTYECKDINITLKLKLEKDCIGLCFSMDKNTTSNMFFVEELDTKYGIKAKLYSPKRGTTGTVKIKKNVFADNTFKECDIIYIINGGEEPKYNYKNNKKVPTGEMEYILKKYTVEEI